MLIIYLIILCYCTIALTDIIDPLISTNNTRSLENESFITPVENIASKLDKIANKSVDLECFTQESFANNSDTFLSFDEWKKIKEQEIINNQKFIDRSLDIRTGVDASCYGDKECIGEEMEIDLNFFSSSDYPNTEPEGKIYNDKFNYASLDCAATIVKTNSEASGASSILIENKDKYLLNLCSAPNQFFIIELCEDILVEQIVMANFEYFSSNFRNFVVSVSDRFPVPRNGWTKLGEFKGTNSKSLQKFNISNPQIWAKYLRIEILDHYDDEFYCPISLIRVHGRTMMDEFKSQVLEDQKQGSSLEKHIVNNNANSIDTNGTNAANREYELIETTKRESDTTRGEPSSTKSIKSKMTERKYIMESDLLGKPNNWPYINAENKTLIPQLPDPMEWYESILEPLRFEEFLKELSPDLFNCDPAEREISHNLSSSNLIAKGINNTNMTNTLDRNGTDVLKKLSPIASTSSPEDSIFRNIIRRINFLENNSTMIILYVEEQSKLLSKSFHRLETIYLNRFDHLVSTFNVTVMNNIDILKEFAKHLKEESLILLEEQKRNNEDFNNKNQYRIQKLEEDIRFQRKMLILFIFILLFMCYHQTIKYLLYKRKLNTDKAEISKILKINDHER